MNCLVTKATVLDYRLVQAKRYYHRFSLGIRVLPAGEDQDSVVLSCLLRMTTAVSFYMPRVLSWRTLAATA